MICEVCGKDMPFTKKVSIEGSVMRACSGCARFGAEVAPGAPMPTVRGGERVVIRVKKPGVRDIYSEMGTEELARDFGSRIRNARSKMGLKQDELGVKINEKRSVIESLESGRMHPDDRLVAKLERALGIKLKERVDDDGAVMKRGRGGLTIGDIIKKDEK